MPFICGFFLQTQVQCWSFHDSPLYCIKFLLLYSTSSLNFFYHIAFTKYTFLECLCSAARRALIKLPSWTEGREIFPDLSLITSFYTWPTKLLHTSNKSCEEVAWTTRKITNSRLGCRVAEEHFVRTQETFSWNQILEIHIVKFLWSSRMRGITSSECAFGQALINCSAYSGSKEGSILDDDENEWRRFENLSQWETPIVWAPDSAIISSWVRLCLLKMEFSCLRLKEGSGSFPATLDAFEISPSRRPSSTLNDGPLAWESMYIEGRIIMLIDFYSFDFFLLVYYM